MENTIENWCCPLCKSPLILNEYPSKRGFILKCKGTDAVPHELRMYLSGFRKDASFLPAPRIVRVEIDTPAPRLSRAKELLARAAALSGEEEQAA